MENFDGDRKRGVGIQFGGFEFDNSPRRGGGMVSPKNEKSPCFLAFATSFSPFTGCIFLYEFDDHTRNVFPRRGFNAF